MTVPRHSQFKTRHWPLAVFLGLLVALVVTIIVVTNQQPRLDTLQMTDAPKATILSQTPNLEPVIEPGEVTRIYVPGTEINHGVLSLDSCLPEIDPPREGSLIGAVYACTKDFEQPSTSSTSLSVLAGHSSCKVDTVFNKLNKLMDTLQGREVWIQTTATDGRWLIYQVEQIYNPPKDQLPYVEEIWGSSEISTAGKLALVTCLLGDCGGGSTNNLVAVAKFIGVK